MYYAYEVIIIRNRIYNILEKWVKTYPFHNEEFRKSVEYIVLSDAKYVRSIIALSLYEGVSGESSESFEKFLLSIEIVHAASLLLDDLPSFDDASLRRNKKTHHQVFGEAKTILTAFFLLNEAYGLISFSQELVKLLNEAVSDKGLIGGEYDDLFGKKDSFDNVKNIHMLKTTPLFNYAILGTLFFFDEKNRKALWGDMQLFSTSLGKTFQLMDDMLDRFSKSEVTGKDVNKDNGKYVHTEDKRFVLDKLKNEIFIMHELLKKHFPKTEGLYLLLDKMEREFYGKI